MKNVTILGHSGFIGTHLLRILPEVFDCRTRGLSFPEVDLADVSSQGSLLAIFADSDVVILCAAVKRQFGDSLEAFNRNIRIVENCLAALTGTVVKQFIFMSSAAVYGEETHNTEISESTLVRPTSYYGIAKFTGECLLRKGLEKSHTGLLCLRPPLIYGLGDAGNTYGPSGFTTAAKADREIVLWGDGTELREFLYVEDFVKIVGALIQTGETGILNIVSGKSYTFKDILTEIETVQGKVFTSERTRSKAKVDNGFNASLLRGILSEQFVFTDLKTGVKSLLNA